MRDLVITIFITLCLLLQDKGHNYIFTACRLDNADVNIAGLFL